MVSSSKMQRFLRGSQCDFGQGVPAEIFKDSLGITGQSSETT